MIPPQRGTWRATLNLGSVSLSKGKCLLPVGCPYQMGCLFRSKAGALWLSLFLALAERNEHDELPQIAARWGLVEGRSGQTPVSATAMIRVPRSSAIQQWLEGKQKFNLDLEKRVEKQIFKWDFCVE